MYKPISGILAHCVLDVLMAAFPMFRMFLPLIGLPMKIVLMVGFGVVVTSNRAVVFKTVDATRTNMCTLGHHLKIALGLLTAPDVLLNQIGTNNHSFLTCNALHANVWAMWPSTATCSPLPSVYSGT
jgi:hypothetical protein